MKLLFCGTGWFSIIDHIADAFPPDVRDIARIERWRRREPLADAVRDVDVILPSNAHITADVIGAASRLVLIQQPAAGIDNIDLAAARERGIPVCNAPSSNSVSVAEAAVFLILSLARQLNQCIQAFKDRQIGQPAGVELAGKTLGIIGLGRSGQALDERARGLGMRVVGVTSRSTDADRRALLSDSDVISLHCPLTPHTRGSINAEAFALMRPGALLVNCARGPIVDREAVEQALATGRLGGFALDTPWEEPWDPDDPLYARPDVVVTPHIAGSTRESFGRIAAIVADNIARVHRGEEPLHRVA